MVKRLGGESVTYQPYGGVARTFLALVDRRPMAIQEGAPAQYGTNMLQVAFPIDAVDGVLTVATRKDKISFKRNLSDGTATVFTVQKIRHEDSGIVAQDRGMFYVTVQA